MAGLNDTIYPSLSLFLDSENADIKESDANCAWFLNETVIVPVGTRVMISLTDFEMPYSFYNVNETNNKLVIQTTSGTETFILPPSNYDVDNVLTTLNLQLANKETELGTLIVMTFSFSSNKFTFTSGTLDFTITTDTTLDFELGLGNLPVSSTSLVLTTANTCNFAGTPFIQLNTDLGIRNLDNRGRSFGVLTRIPVRTEPSQYIFHQATENLYFVLDERKIESIKVQLVDFKGRELILNGAIFSITISLTFQHLRIPKDTSFFKLENAYRDMFVEKSKQDKNKKEE
jgi:hypothetical protein